MSAKRLSYLLACATVTIGLTQGAILFLINPPRGTLVHALGYTWAATGLLFVINLPRAIREVP